MYSLTLVVRVCPALNMALKNDDAYSNLNNTLLDEILNSKVFNNRIKDVFTNNPEKFISSVRNFHQISYMFT